MSHPARRLCLPLLLVLACALPAGGAQAASTENVAEAVATEDGSRVFDFAWDVDRQRGGRLEHVNRAEARGSCTGCEATAIAFQIVLAWDSPNPVMPQNLAVAVNESCTGCLATAHARQFVRVLDTPVRLTSHGRAELADVRRDLRALEALDPPPDQLYLAVEAQEARVEAVLEDDLVRRSDPGEEPDLLDSELLQAGEIG